MSDALSDAMPSPRERAIGEAKWVKVDPDVGLYVAILWEGSTIEAVAVTTSRYAGMGMSIPDGDVTVYLPKDPKYKHYRMMYNETKNKKAGKRVT